MVTDEERDYMYSVYASDPQMRLNVGIRRRLAPLVENSRRRVELLNTMLFSFPGTPIVYYGDELGMGDNIYLGDRNGVRTPMQWSSDRNAGFSRADPAQLYAPPIQDPVYGYQSINVEAQERYPFSPLNWNKRLIAMRKQHRVFGRGTIEFVPCANRKILGYLRRDEKETILIVVNLSRTVQPAELDLKPFTGLLPVEMSGLTEFPRIGETPYFLTLGPYAYYWFTLQHEPVQKTAKAAAPIDPNAAIVESLPNLFMGVEWQNVLDAATRGILERQALSAFLQRQRWFAAKSRTIREARFSDWSPLRTGATPSFLDGDAAAHLVKTTPAAVLARITGARKGAIVDGLMDDDACSRILALVERGDEVATRRGSVQGTRVGNPTALFAGPAQEHKWTRGGADQSNSVAFFNDKSVLKLFRRIEPAANPEYEIGRFLTTRQFTRIPALIGALEYLRPGFEPGTLAVVQTSVKHQGSGWDFTIDELRRYYERVAAREGPEGREGVEPREGLDAPPRLFVALENWYLASAATPASRARVGDRQPGLQAGADRSRVARRARRRHARARVGVARSAREPAGVAQRRVAADRRSGARRARGAARALRRRPPPAARRHADPRARRLSSRPGAADRRGLRDPRLRGRAGAIDRRAAREAVAAQGRRRHGALVRLCGVRGVVRLHGARARRVRAAGAVGRHVGALGDRRIPQGLRGGGRRFAAAAARSR